MGSGRKRVEVAGSVVSRLLGSLGPSEGGALVPLSIFQKWPQAVGERIAAHTCPVALSGEVLWLEVDHAAWQSEIYYLGPTLVQQVNRCVGRQIISQVKVRSARPSPPPPPPSPPREPVNEDDVDFAQAYSTPIVDPQVRAAFEGMLAQLTCRRRALGPAAAPPDEAEADPLEEPEEAEED